MIQTPLKSAFCATLLLWAPAWAAPAEESSAVELLLPGGTLYSVDDRTYRSLGLPTGWTVMAGAYSPDLQSLALLLVGKGIPPKPMPVAARRKRKGQLSLTKTTPVPAPPEGPVSRAVRPWEDSTRLLIINRRTGAPSRTWRVPVGTAPADWTLSWTSAAGVAAISYDAGLPADRARTLFEFDVAHPAASNPRIAPPVTGPPMSVGVCPLTLAEVHFQGETDRFTQETISCSTSSETSDLYRIVRDNARTHKEDILWEYRVAADTATCSSAGACYTGKDAHFLSTEEQLFLDWDGDLYALRETDDGMDIQLVTQLLPEFNRPWAIAAGRTHLHERDTANKVDYQPVNPALALAHLDHPQLYAQNFCPIRSFIAAVDIGPYDKRVWVPAGYQMGPVDIGSFQDRAYTPVLISVVWTSFHHVVDPVYCQQPYTIASHTRGIVVSLSESEHGPPRCQIQTQNDPLPRRMPDPSGGANEP